MEYVLIRCLTVSRIVRTSLKMIIVIIMNPTEKVKWNGRL